MIKSSIGQLVNQFHGTECSLIADSYQLAKTLPVLRNLKVHHVHTRPAVNPITSQSHPVQIFTSYSL